MKVTILLFAGVRTALGRDHVDLEIDPGTTAGALLQALARAFPAASGPLSHCRVAVDQAFVPDSHAIHAATEIAVIPPVSGGHDGDARESPAPAPARIALSGRPLALDPVVAAVAHAHAGGIATFTGNVRRDSRGKAIDHLEYEAYGPMAEREMERIAASVEAAIPAARVAIHHRIGHLRVGETAVIIAASAPHRAEAFEACRAAIEALKRDVPIWKREVADDGSSWYGRGP